MNKVAKHMKILHTADWHLGKRLNLYPRLEEQKEVLAEICDIATKHAVDLIIVAGDLFDAFNPPNEATELLYRTLKKLSRNAQVPVIAIAGNHDSPDRINVADVLARENGIIFIGYPTDEVPLFSLENSFSVVMSEPGFIELSLPQLQYPVRILHTAFANEVRLKEYLGQDKQQSLQESLTQKWQFLADKYCDNKGVNLLTTHLFMAKHSGDLPDEPDGEKPLNIGNADIVYSDAIPTSIQYAALGHLHRYQNVGTHQPVIYSSSPLAYSFSEAGQEKRVVIIEAEPGKEVVYTPVVLKSGKQLKRKTFPDVSAAIQWLLENPDTLVELTVETEEYLKSAERKALLQSHDGIIYLIPRNKNNAVNATSQTTNPITDIHELFKEYFKTKNGGQEPNQEIMDLFKEIENAD